MSMAKKFFFGGGVSVGNTLTNSLLLSSSNSSYLSRTPSAAGNRKKWTWSGWIKRTTLSTGQFFFGANSGGSVDGGLVFTASNTLGLALNGNVYNKYTTAVLSSVSDWYHIVCVLDTDNATATSRIKIYIDGVEQTSYTTQNSGLPPSGYTPPYFNNSNNHDLGKLAGYASNYFDGYMADVIFVDGQTLTPTSFGYDNGGSWEWKDYTGTFGSNGFRLLFADGTSTTTLGYDTSTNGNDWTLNNLATSDQKTDIPA